MTGHVPTTALGYSNTPRETASDNRWLTELFCSVLFDTSLARHVVDHVPAHAFAAPHRRITWQRLTELARRAGVDGAPPDASDVVWWIMLPEAEELRAANGIDADSLPQHTALLLADARAVYPKCDVQRALDLARSGNKNAAEQATIHALQAAVKKQAAGIDAGGSLDSRYFADALVQISKAEADQGRSLRSERRARDAEVMGRLLDPNRPARAIVPTGLTDLDKALRGGPGVGELTAVALPTGLGKTMLAGAICRGVLCPGSGRPVPTDPNGADLARRVETSGAKVRVLLWVGEDTVDLVWNRIEQDLLDASSETLDDPEKRAQLFAAREGLLAAVSEILQSPERPVSIIDRLTLQAKYGGTGRELESLTRYSHAWANEERRDAAERGEPEPALLVMADYIQILEVDPRLKLDRTKELRHVSQALCDLAERQRVAVLVFAQMNGRLNHQAAETNSMREAADIEHACSVVIYGDALNSDEVRKLAKVTDLATLQEEQVKLAKSTLELTFRKGRKVARASAAYLRLDLSRQRITDVTHEDAQVINDGEGESPLKVARDLLSPKRRRNPSSDPWNLTVGKSQ